MSSGADMTALTAAQLLAVFVAYQLAFYAVPALALHRRVAHRRLCERFLIYLVAGHVAVINLVFALTLLHVSNVLTLLAGGSRAAAARP
ncbi:MAG: hypothetical protein SOI26_02070 [Coriobacteriales bacterium]|jgi:hypothetical protein